MQKPLTNEASPALHIHPARRRTLRDGDGLASAGLVDATRIAEIDKIAQRYSVAVTPVIADAIDPQDPNDPIARQFLPDVRELAQRPEELSDPIGDDTHAPIKGIVHRYPDRVLLTPILHCPVYCRFCFRREKVGGEEAILSEEDLARAFDYIRAHEEVWEVVITGGDPLMLPPARVARIVQTLNAIPHVATIRFHSRAPISDPARIDARMVEALASEKALWLAVHCNHPREMTEPARAACRALSAAGIPLLGQTVLLKGVNDDPLVMETLMRTLVANRIKPYYLHHLDLAPGTNHFRTGIPEGQNILKYLRGRVSGLCQPTYVLDIPGGYGKAPLGPIYWDGETVEDWQGERHIYPPRD